MNKFYLFVFLLTPQVRTQTMIDTIYSDPRMDGSVTEYFIDSSFYVDNEGVVGVGDFIADSPGAERAFFSFDLSKIGKSRNIQSAVFEIVQYLSYGNGVSGKYPVWDVPFGDTMFCIADHINYGDTLEFWDWGAGDSGDERTFRSNIGVLSKDSSLGVKSLDVTSSFRTDVAAGRKYSQFRLRFPILSDNDNRNDMISFRTGEYVTYGAPLLAPRLIVKSTVTGVRPNDHVVTVGSSIDHVSLYPNPFNANAILTFTVSSPQQYRIEMYDCLGRSRQTILDEFVYPSKRSVMIGSPSLPSGLYFVRITSSEGIAIVKAMIMK